MANNLRFCQVLAYLLVLVYSVSAIHVPFKGKRASTIEYYERPKYYRQYHVKRQFATVNASSTEPQSTATDDHTSIGTTIHLSSISQFTSTSDAIVPTDSASDSISASETPVNSVSISNSLLPSSTEEPSIFTTFSIPTSADSKSEIVPQTSFSDIYSSIPASSIETTPLDSTPTSNTPSASDDAPSTTFSAQTHVTNTESQETDGPSTSPLDASSNLQTRSTTSSVSVSDILSELSSAFPSSMSTRSPSTDPSGKFFSTNNCML